MNHNDPFLTIDRAHERQAEADEDFEAALARETVIQAAAMRSNALTGHAQTLSDLAESLAFRLGQSGATEQLVRVVLTSGVHTSGQMLLDLVGKCIADDAEIAALKELERGQRAGGLNVAAMRAVAPAGVMVTL